MVMTRQLIKKFKQKLAKSQLLCEILCEERKNSISLPRKKGEKNNEN